MNMSYKYINTIALIISVYSTCSGMNQMAITPSSFSHLPKEINIATFNLLDLKSQDHLRGTCNYWKKIGDERTDHACVLRLLHSPSYSTERTKTRILFYAIHNDHYDLTKHILDSTPDKQLYLKPIRGYGLDPYHVAQGNNNEIIINLLKEHHYDKPNHGVDTYNQKIECFKWPKEFILQKLLIASISGDDIAFEEIVHHADLSQKEISSAFYFGKPLNTSSLAKRIILETSFYIIIQNNDDLCIESCIKWIKNNPEFDFLLNLLLQEALEKRSTKVFEKLLQSKDNINQIEVWEMNGVTTARTLKNILLDKQWNSDIPQEYYDEAEALLNEYGAKTIKELHQEESLQ